MKVRGIKNSNAKKMVDIFDDVKKIFIKPSKPSVPIDKESDEQSDEQQGQGVKILTPK